MTTNPRTAPESPSEIVNIENEAFDFNIFWKIDNLHDKKPQSEKINELAKKQIENDKEYIYDLPVFPFIIENSFSKEKEKELSNEEIAKYVANLSPKDTDSEEKYKDNILEYFTAAIVLACWNAKEKNIPILNFEELKNNNTNVGIAKALSILTILQKNPTPVPQSIGEILQNPYTANSLITSANALYDSIKKNITTEQSGIKILQNYPKSGLLPLGEVSNSAANIAAGVTGGLAGSLGTAAFGGGIIPQISVGLISSIAAKSGMRAYRENKSFAHTLGEDFKATGEAMVSGGKSIINYVHKGPEQERLQRVGVVAGGSAVVLGGIWGLWKIMQKMSEPSKASSIETVETKKNWSTAAKWGIGIGGVALGGAALTAYLKNIIPNFPLELLKKEMEKVESAKDEIQKKMEQAEERVATLEKTLASAVGVAREKALGNPISEELEKAKEELEEIKEEEKIINEAEEALMIQAAQEGKKVQEKKEASEGEKQQEKALKKVYEDTWPKTLEILVRKGFLTQDTANTIGSYEEFIKFLETKKEKNPTIDALYQMIGEKNIDIRMYYGAALATVIIGFLMKDKIKTAAGIGLGGSIAMYLMGQDTKRSAQEIQKSHEALSEIYSLFTKGLQNSGYNASETSKLFEDLLGINLAEFLSFQDTVTPENAQQNREGYKGLLEVLKSKRGTDAATAHILEETIEKVQTMVVWHEEIIQTKVPKTISLQTVESIFFNASFLGIAPIPKSIHSQNTKYNFQLIGKNNTVISFQNFTYNPFPQEKSEEEKTLAWNEKQFSLWGEFERQFAMFKEYSKNNTSILGAVSLQDIDSIYKDIIAINNDDTELFPNEKMKTVLQRLEIIRNIPGVIIENPASDGAIFVTFPPDKVRTCIGFSESFSKEGINPQDISAFDKGVLEELLLKQNIKLANESVEQQKNNIIELYKTLPENSPLKKHFEKYLKTYDGKIDIDTTIFSNSVWLGEFMRLLFLNPTDSLFAKIESGRLVVVTPLASFALWSFLDPISVQAEVLTQTFEGDAAEWIYRSFFGPGVLFASLGALKGLAFGKGNRIGSVAAGAFKGLRVLNPLINGVHSTALLAYRKHLNKDASLFKINLERMKDPNKYVPVWIRYFMKGDEEFLFKELLRNQKELNLYVDNSKNTRSIHWAVSHHTDTISQKSEVIKSILTRKFKYSTKDLENLEELAKAMADSPDKYETLLKQHKPVWYYKSAIDDAFINIKSSTTLINIKKDFDDITTEINGRSDIPDLDKASFFQQSNERKLAALLKNTNTTNLAVIKTILEDIKIEMETNRTTLMTNTTGDLSTQYKDKILKRMNGNIEYLEKAIDQCSRGEIPHIPRAYMQFHLNPWGRYGVNISGLNTLHVLGKVGTIGGYGLGAVAGGIGIVEGVSEIILKDGLGGTEVQESVQYLYSVSGWIKATAGAIEIGSLWFGPIASTIATSILEPAKATVLGGVEAELDARVNSKDASLIWSEDTILRKIPFHNDDNAQIALKNWWNTMLEKDTGNSVDEIRTILWEALMIVAAQKEGYTGLAQIQFFKAYTHYINTKTNGTYSVQSMQEVFQIKKNAEEYAKSNANTANYLIENRHGTVKAIQAESDLPKLSPVEKFIKNESAPEEKADTSFIGTLYTIAKDFGYTGEKNEYSLQSFFRYENREKYGIYWLSDKDISFIGDSIYNAGWHVHRMESFLPDTQIEGATDREKISSLIATINKSYRSTFTKENDSTFQQKIEDMRSFFGGDSQNENIAQNTVQKINTVATQSILLSHPEKDKVLQNSNTTVEKAIMLFSIIDGIQNPITLSNVKNHYEENIFDLESVLKYMPSTNQWKVQFMQNKAFIIQSSEDIKKIQNTIGDEKGNGKVMILKSCLEVVEKYINK